MVLVVSVPCKYISNVMSKVLNLYTHVTYNIMDNICIAYYFYIGLLDTFMEIRGGQFRGRLSYSRVRVARKDERGGEGVDRVTKGYELRSA